MRPPLPDAAVRRVLLPVTWLTLALPALLLVFVFLSALPALGAAGPLAFLTDTNWAPTSGRYNLLPMVAGSVVSSLLALLIATPPALAYGFHVNLYAGHRWARVGRATVGLLAGIPSVVFGLVALTRLVPLLVEDHPPGLGLGVSAVTLGVMIFPTAAAGCDAAVAQVGTEGVVAVRALGLGAWDAARAVVWPLALPGIRAGLVLALARALGETMAVLMVAGNTVAWPTGLFAPFRTLTGNIAVEMAYATDLHRAALFTSALVLFGLVGGINTLAGRRA